MEILKVLTKDKSSIPYIFIFPFAKICNVFDKLKKKNVHFLFRFLLKGYSTQQSLLYLIDLAGSERAGGANMGNDSESNLRLKEGTKINLSLTSLGLVIKGLVENHSHIPYRNSQLTRLLQNSLGGNSMTSVKFELVC